MTAKQDPFAVNCPGADTPDLSRSRHLRQLHNFLCIHSTSHSQAEGHQSTTSTSLVTSLMRILMLAALFRRHSCARKKNMCVNSGHGTTSCRGQAAATLQPGTVKRVSLCCSIACACLPKHCGPSFGCSQETPHSAKSSHLGLQGKMSCAVHTETAQHVWSWCEVFI